MFKHIVKNQTVYLYLLMLMLGLISGFSDVAFLQSLGTTIADIFIKIFKCISTPIIALSLIVTISSFAGNAMSLLWRKTLYYTLSTTIIAASLSCVLYYLIQPANIHAINIPTAADGNQLNYLSHLLAIIPSNLFAPFLEQQVLSVLFIGVTIGIAIPLIPDADAKRTVTLFFKGLYGIFIVVTKWVVALLPLALYGFITTTALQFKHGVNLSGIGLYLLVIVLANLIQGLVILPTWLKLNGLNSFSILRKTLPALSVAFFSKSSSGTLPVTIETAERNLKLNSKISRFVLPLCTSINMNGCAAFIFATVIYLMQNHGVIIHFSTMLCWIFIATIAAIGNAGVPMGCFFLSASLLSSMNVPITLLGLILPFYSLIDMLETALNVWSDTCVATVINKKLEKEVTILRDLKVEPEAG